MPGSSSGLTGRHSVCWWNVDLAERVRPVGRSADRRVGRAAAPRGTRTSWCASSVSCAAPNTPCTRSAGPSTPGTRRSAATCDALRPSRSTSTSIVIGPGGTGARKIAFAVTSARSGAVECLLHRAQRGVHRDAAEDVHDLPAVGDVGVEAARPRRGRASAWCRRGGRERIGSSLRSRLVEPRCAAAARATSGTTRRAPLLGEQRPLNIFATLAHHPKLLKRWLVFGNHVLAKSTLPARDRELLILRTGWRCRRAVRVGPARRDRPRGRASPTTRSRASPMVPTRRAGRDRRRAARCAPPTSCTTTRRIDRRDVRARSPSTTTSSSCSTSCSPSGSTTSCRWR